MSLLLLTGIMFGAATFMPGLTKNRQDWFGLRCLLVLIAIQLLLYVGNVILGISLELISRAIALAGAVGVARILWLIGRGRDSRRALMPALRHPVWVLTLVMLLVASMHRFPDYMSYPGDEIASWLRLAKQIFLADAYWSGLVDFHLGGYPNGWPLMLAFPSLILGSFSDSHPSALPFIMHLAVIGTVYDLLRDWCRRDLPEGGFPGLFAALVVFSLLSAEALWVLYPSDLLIDRPMIYVWAAIFMTGLHGLRQPGETDRHALLIGLLAAFGYLFKVSLIGVLPSMGIIWLGWVWLSRGDVKDGLSARAFVRAAMMLSPLAVAYVSWAVLKTGEHCLASPLSLFGSPAETFSTTNAVFARDLYLQGAATYLAGYKLPVTLIGGAGLLAGLLDRRLRWVTLAMAAFLICYSFALYLSYLGCLNAEDAGHLQSFDRYFRPNLRLIHFCGIIVLALLVWAMMVRRGFAARAMQNERFRFACGFAVIVFLTILALQMDRSYVQSTTRFLETEKLRTVIHQVRGEARYLIRLIQDRNLVRPRVTLIAQGGYNVELDLARDAAIRRTRDGAAEQGYFHYDIDPAYNWGPVPGKFSLRVTTPEALLQTWQGTDILWPVNLDDWVTAVLDDLTAGGCPGPYTDYFILRDAENRFICAPKIEQKN